MEKEWCFMYFIYQSNTLSLKECAVLTEYYNIFFRIYYISAIKDDTVVSAIRQWQNEECTQLKSAHCYSAGLSPNCIWALFW